MNQALQLPGKVLFVSLMTAVFFGCYAFFIPTPETKDKFVSIE